MSKSFFFNLLMLTAILFALSTNSNKLVSADFYPNNIYAGLGVGANFYDGSKNFQISLNYNRIFEYTEPKLSVGLLIEGLLSPSHSVAAFGLPIGFHATENLNLWISPAYILNGKKTPLEDNEHFKYGDGFMLSLGGGYSISLSPDNQYSIMPFLSGNIINYEFILSVGVKFGLNFADYSN